MADESDVTDEHARYAQVLTELDELEEALTEAETQASRAGHLGDREADEDENSLPLL